VSRPGGVRPFGRKLILAVTVTSGIAVTAVAVPLAITDYVNLRRDAIARVRSQAAMVSLESGAALVFGDAGHAEQALASLRAVPDVAGAALYDSEGRLFADYRRATGLAPPPAAASAPSDGERTSDRWLFVSTPVVDLGETQGQLEIVYDLEPLVRRLRATIATAIVATGAAMLAVYVIARRIRRSLTAPIDELARAATAVSVTHDYSRRAAKLSDDELGQLTDAFNEMLVQIGRQEGELNAAHSERGALLERERAARTEAERASRMKDEFLATLSHELRTPLTPIMGWLEVLRFGPPRDEQAQRALEVIERNARVLMHLIEDLLDMNRIISGKVRLEVQPLELASVIDAAVTTVRPSADARSIRLEIALAPGAGMVRGDPNRLQQVVWNLLSNAIRFTPYGGRVGVALRPTDSQVEIVIRDNGQGIRPEFLPFVFDPFRQADSTTTRQHGGLGLGLAIVRQLVELHGGTVRADSPGEGQGATFTVALPALAPSQQEAVARGLERAGAGVTAASAGPPSVTGMHVLVVDDDEDARELLARMLTAHGARVSRASGAREALLLVSEIRPDVVISDIGMPGLDGYELIRHLRSLPPEEGGATPSIAVTAFARAEDRARAILEGYQLHLAKPLSATELVAAIASLRGRNALALAIDPPDRRPD
jgi:signal transduction histidine kinase/ActR/RegA family two-component response regulator